MFLCLLGLVHGVRVPEKIIEPFKKVLNACRVFWVYGQLQRPTRTRLDHLLIETIEHGTGARRVRFWQERDDKSTAIEHCNDIAGPEHVKCVVSSGPGNLQPVQVLARNWRLDQHDRKDSVVARVPFNFGTQTVQERLRATELPMSLLLFIFGFGYRTHYYLPLRARLHATSYDPLEYRP